MRPGSDEMDRVGSGIHSIDQKPVRLDVALAMTPPGSGQLMVSASLGQLFRTTQFRDDRLQPFDVKAPPLGKLEILFELSRVFRPEHG